LFVELLLIPFVVGGKCCRGGNWCLYLRCWEAKPKLDYGLLRWYLKAFGVIAKPIQARNKGCTWQNSSKSL